MSLVRYGSFPTNIGNKMLTHTELKAKALENKEVRQAYDELKEKYALINKLLNAKQSMEETDLVIEHAEIKKPQ